MRLWAACFIASVAACGGGSGSSPVTPPTLPEPTAPVASILITRTVDSDVPAVVPDNLSPGTTVQLYASVRDARGTYLHGRAVQWGSTYGTAATIDQSGLLKIGVGPASTTVSATSESKTALLTVKTPLTPGTYSVTIGLSAAEVRVGSGITIPITVTTPPDMLPSINLSSSNPAVAEVHYSSEKEVSVAGRSVGTAVITVSAAADPTAKASATITVK